MNDTNTTQSKNLDELYANARMHLAKIKMTRREAAKRLNVHYGYLGDCLNGKMKYGKKVCERVLELQSEKR